MGPADRNLDEFTTGNHTWVFVFVIAETQVIKAFRHASVNPIPSSRSAPFERELIGVIITDILHCESIIPVTRVGLQDARSSEIYFEIGNCKENKWNGVFLASHAGNDIPHGNDVYVMLNIIHISSYEKRMLCMVYIPYIPIDLGA